MKRLFSQGLANEGLLEEDANMPLPYSDNGTHIRGDLISGLLSVGSRRSKRATVDFVLKGGNGG